MTDVARAELTSDLGLDFDAERSCQSSSHVEHRSRPARADVQGLAVSPRGLDRKQVRARDISNVDEVPALKAVLEDQRTLAI